MAFTMVIFTSAIVTYLGIGGILGTFLANSNRALFDAADHYTYSNPFNRLFNEFEKTRDDRLMQFWAMAVGWLPLLMLFIGFIILATFDFLLKFPFLFLGWLLDKIVELPAKIFGWK